MKTYETIIIGDGIAGLSLAHRLKKSGYESIVIVAPKNQVESASIVATGLSTLKGQYIPESSLFDLKIKSHAYLKNWLRELGKDCGKPLNVINGVYEPFSDEVDFQKSMRRTMRGQFWGLSGASLVANSLGLSKAKCMAYFPDDFAFSVKDVFTLLGFFLRDVTRIDTAVDRLEFDGGRIGLRVGGDLVQARNVVIAAGYGTKKILENSGINCGLNSSWGAVAVGAVDQGEQFAFVKAKNAAVHCDGEFRFGSASSEEEVASLVERARNFIPFERFQIESGVRCLFRDRIPRFERINIDSSANLFQFTGLYKNGLAFAPFLAQGYAIKLIRKLAH